MTEDLVVRLLGAIDEREAWANAAASDTEPGWEITDLSDSVYTSEQGIPVVVGPWGGGPGPAGPHIVGNDPRAVLRLCQAHRDIVAMFPVSSPHLDTEGSFYGFQSRDCGEHRTAGSHRAWCFDCSEWCYPKDPCRRCHGVSEVLLILARGYGLEEA